MLFRYRKLSIKALPDNLPDFFEVDISKLRIGGMITVDTLMKDEFTILHPDTTVVVQVKAARNAVLTDDEEEDEEGAAVTETAAESNE